MNTLFVCFSESFLKNVNINFTLIWNPRTTGLIAFELNSVTPVSKIIYLSIYLFIFDLFKKLINYLFISLFIRLVSNFVSQSYSQSVGQSVSKSVS